MLVTDASVWVRALVDESPGGPVRSRLEQETHVEAPALIDLEFLSAIRALLMSRSISRDKAEYAIGRFLDAPVERHSHELLVPRVWELRANLTPHDASYVALAEAFGATLLTLDRRLARAPGIHCPIDLIE